MEKFVIFAITLLLISNIIISIRGREVAYYFDKIALLALWGFLVLYDTRKVWPYADIRIKGNKSKFNKESLILVLLILLLVWAVIEGTVLPLVK